MTKVITYGTFDMLHYGHQRLLRRAKTLGDYLIVGVTAEDFDRRRGKINVKQSLMERIENVRATGLADEIIVEEYEGQKIDDIRRYGIDIFTVGSDWIGKFDYLNEYCQVIYLPRTQNISSSDLRSKDQILHMGIVGNNSTLSKVIKESNHINGLCITAIYTQNRNLLKIASEQRINVIETYHNMLSCVQAIYIGDDYRDKYERIVLALKAGIHVLCENPIASDKKQCETLFAIAEQNHVILMDGIKTAYATAYNRLLLLVKSQKIGSVVSIDATCTSWQDVPKGQKFAGRKSITAWGPTAMLPVFQILGTEYQSTEFTTAFSDSGKSFDFFTKIDIRYRNAVASIKVGKGVKSEGELIITGTKGYIYVPAPWWKTDYFEVRFENQNNNKRYFYSLEGEGIQYELLVFLRSIMNNRDESYIPASISIAIAEILQSFDCKKNMIELEVER